MALEGLSPEAVDLKCYGAVALSGSLSIAQLPTEIMDQ